MIGSFVGSEVSAISISNDVINYLQLSLPQLLCKRHRSSLNPEDDQYYGKFKRLTQLKNARDITDVANAVFIKVVATHVAHSC